MQSNLAATRKNIHIPHGNTSAAHVSSQGGIGWVSTAGPIHIKLQRACLPTEGAAVTAFLAARSTNWAEMGPHDQVELIEWLDRGLARKSPEWEQSSAAVAIAARNKLQDWVTPNIWDHPEMAAWRERRSVVSASDLADLFIELESAMEVANDD